MYITRPLGTCSFWVPKDNKGHIVPKYLSLEFFEVPKITMRAQSRTNRAQEKKTSFFYIEILHNYNEQVAQFRLERIFQSIKLCNLLHFICSLFRLERIFQSIKLTPCLCTCTQPFRLERIFQSIKLNRHDNRTPAMFRLERIFQSIKLLRGYQS